MNLNEWLQECERQAQRRHGARVAYRQAGLTPTEAERCARQNFPPVPRPIQLAPTFAVRSGALRMVLDGMLVEWQTETGGLWLPVATLHELAGAVSHFKAELAKTMIGDEGDR